MTPLPSPVPFPAPARLSTGLATALLALPLPALAAQDDPAAVQLDRVTVVAHADATERARAALERVPGGTGLVDLRAPAGGRLAGTQDALAIQPGVYAQSPGNEGVKVSMRGSGVNRAPGAHASGVTVLLDGLPLTEPGGTPYELLEPLWAQRVEILRGANGFDRGALALGGAIDYVTRDGRDAAPLELHYEAGSRGYRKYGASSGGARGGLDYYLAWTGTRYDGYQHHASGDGKGVAGTVGWQISPVLETRFYLRYRETFHLTPGRLTQAQVRDDPRAANAAFLAIDARRPQPGSTWLANRTTLHLDEDSTLVAGLAYHDYPMDLQESSYRQRLAYADVNATLDYRHRHVLWGRDSLTTLAAQVTHDLPGNHARETLRFDLGGYPAGTRTRDYVHRGTNSQLRLANDLALAPGLHLQTGLALVYSTRKAWVYWPATAARTAQYQWDYAPRLGLDWQATARTQLFGNLSRSVEPPHPWSMLWGSDQYFGADAGPAAGRQSAAVRLDNQTATTLELGGRGEGAFGRWQLSAYRADVRHELLSVLVGSGADAYVAESNASPTLHRGIEAGLDSPLWQGQAGSLSLRQAYTYGDYRYRGDARFGRNRLPGLPRHYYQAELRYAHPSGFHAGVDTEYASRMEVDYANSVHAPGHLIFGASVGYDAPDGRWQGWLQLRNLGGRRYVATVTPGYDDAGADLARSTPGEGFGLYAGVTWKRR